MLRLSQLAAIAKFLAVSTRGYRFRPWASPYLRWRIETYSGLPADSVTAWAFWRFTWRRRRELGRFLLWAGEMALRGRSAAPASRVPPHFDA